MEDLKIPIKGDRVNVIKLLPHSIITEKAVRGVENVTVEDGYFVKAENLLKVAVIERHNRTGNIGLGLVEDFGLENGAIASTVAHDSHNLIVIGDNDEDMLLAIEELERVGGGLTMVSEGRVLDTLPLTIAGLMSEETLEVVDEKLHAMIELAYNKLKVNRDLDPFMTLSFIALPVIPEIKLTDLGLFDVEEFKFIQLTE